MGTRIFFMLVLLFPVLVAAYTFGGVLYLLMALVLAAHIKQISTRRGLFWLSILTPPVFALALAWTADVSGVVPATVGFAVKALLNVMQLSAATRQQLGGNHVSAILTLAVCTSFFGYIYVAIAWLLWQCLASFGVIRDNFAT